MNSVLRLYKLILLMKTMRKNLVIPSIQKQLAKDLACTN